MNKKIKILLGIALVIIIAVLVWFFFFHKSNSTPDTAVQNVLPFGSGDGAVGGNGNNPLGSGGVTGGEGRSVPHLFKLSDTPVAGAVSFIQNGFTNVRYVERATGHIYDINPVTLEKVRIVNTTIPKVYNAVFKKDGSAVVFQSLPGGGDVIDSVSYVLIPPKATSTNVTYTTVSSRLPSNINELDASANNIFYTTIDGSSIVMSLFDGSKAVSLFSGQFNQWRLYPTTNSVVATTKASSFAPGYSYNINSKTGVIAKLLGPLDGLTVVPNNLNTRAIYSWNDSDNLHLSSLNLVSGGLVDVSPVTLTEKCVWGVRDSSNLYCGVPVSQILPLQIDTWYQGSKHFSDRVWAYNVDTEYAQYIVDPKKTFGIDIDLVSPFLSPDEDYLFFTNKNDLTLWALKLN